MPSLPLFLASTSRYRRDLLERLRLPFSVLDPGVDEHPCVGESPAATAFRLACEKARAVRHVHPAALIIGSDQVAVLGTQRLGKPGNRSNALAQLRAMSGQSVTFHTAVCLLDTASGRERTQEVPTVVKFRKLDEAEIQAYVDADQPYDCAGSAKIEGLGIALVEHVSSDDPTALIGLPLIALANLLRAEGIAVPNT